MDERRRAACAALALVALEHELVVSHGKGPQVVTVTAEQRRGTARVPLDVPNTSPMILAAASGPQLRERGLRNFGDCHGDRDVVGESVLIDRISHSAAWDWLRINTCTGHRRRLRILPRGSVRADRGVVNGHVLLTRNWSSMLG